MCSCTEVGGQYYPPLLCTLYRTCLESSQCVIRLSRLIIIMLLGVNPRVAARIRRAARVKLIRRRRDFLGSATGRRYQLGAKYGVFRSRRSYYHRRGGGVRYLPWR